MYQKKKKKNERNSSKTLYVSKFKSEYRKHRNIFFHIMIIL